MLEREREIKNTGRWREATETLKRDRASRIESKSCAVKGMFHLVQDQSVQRSSSLKDSMLDPFSKSGQNEMIFFL